MFLDDITIISLDNKRRSWLLPSAQYKKSLQNTTTAHNNVTTAMRPGDPFHLSRLLFPHENFILLLICTRLLFSAIHVFLTLCLIVSYCCWDQELFLVLCFFRAVSLFFLLIVGTHYEIR